MKEESINFHDKSIRIMFCELCDGFYLECPRCGNNCCNGGYGEEEDGTPCIMCEKAYELQKILNEHYVLIEDLLLNGTTEIQRKYKKIYSWKKIPPWEKPNDEGQ